VLIFHDDWSFPFEILKPRKSIGKLMKCRVYFIRLVKFHFKITTQLYFCGFVGKLKNNLTLTLETKRKNFLRKTQLLYYIKI
jgi:hypothetical protein